MAGGFYGAHAAFNRNAIDGNLLRSPEVTGSHRHRAAGQCQKPGRRLRHHGCVIELLELNETSGET